MNVQGATILQIGRTNFLISLGDVEQTGPKDFDQNRLVLYARSEEECHSWVSTLKYATQRRLENHYRVGNVIGEGGFALVRIGKCIQTKELRAIKTMKKDAAHAKLFGREVAIIKRVDHPNIVKTFDVFETIEEIHIVMEFIEGGMLYDSIEDGIRFQEADVAQIMRELLDGILYLHRLGIVHRDIKPENVLCTSKVAPLHVKIADFGLSSITSVAELKANRMLMSTMIGTPEFIAPEIARREAYTEKVDIWALGMLCYNTIAGALPLDESMDMIPQLERGVDLTFSEKEWRRYSPLTQSFIRAVLCTDPERRLSPLACLVHPWLDNQNMQSTKVGAHGRVSAFLFSGESGWPPRNTRPIRERQLDREGRFDDPKWSARREWLMAFAAVTALNRFNWLINPRQPSSEDPRRNQVPGASSKTKIRYSAILGGHEDQFPSPGQGNSQFSIESCGSFNSGRDQDSSKDSLVLNVDKAGEAETDSEDEGTSSIFSSLMKNLQDAVVPSKSLKFEPQSSPDLGSERSGKSKPRSSIEQPKSAPAKVIAMQNSVPKRAGRKSDQLAHEYGEPLTPLAPLPPRKPTLRKKLMAAMTSDSSAAMTPMRKLSRKLTRKADKKRTKSIPLGGEGGDVLDLDAGLRDLSLTQVDEEDILMLDEIEAEAGAPGLDGMMSPTTPEEGKKKQGKARPFGRKKREAVGSEAN